ncbi:MAG: SDR family NAD(P)-dependent oxidoreductase [Clostridia bacterium]
MRYTLLTGSTGGLGSAFACKIAEKGENLFLTATNQERLEKQAKDIVEKYHINVLSKACDLADCYSRNELFEFVKNKNIDISMLINNAGYITEGEFLKQNDEDIIKAIKINCEGTVDVTQKCLKLRNKELPFKIITVSSLACNYAMPNMAIYAATKSFISKMMMALAIELKNENVTITTITPSGIYTTPAMNEAIRSQGIAGKLSSHSPEYIVQFALKACEKGKIVAVPGVFNRFIKCITKPVSDVFVARQVGKRWKKSQIKREQNFSKKLVNEKVKGEK